MSDEPELTAEQRADLEADLARFRAQDEAEEALYADQLAEGRRRAQRPVLLPVDDVVARRAVLIRAANERLGKS